MLIPLVIFLTAAVEPATAAPSPRPSASALVTSLQPTLDVHKQGRSLAFTMKVHNAGSEAAELQFTDAGLLQIVVTSGDGSQLYDSRAGRMFATVMKSVTVEPGKDATFTHTWDAPPSAAGTLRVRATVRATAPLTASCTVEL